MRIHTITDLDGPGLQPYRTMRRPVDHLKQGIFVAEGEKVVTRLLATSLAVRSVLLTPEWLGLKRRLLEARTPAPDVFVAEKNVLEGIVGFALHQGIMALGDVPPPTALEDVVRTATRPLLLLALDDLVNAENVGVIVRNAHAFGVSGLLVGETSSSPYLRRAVRNSMGSVFSVPIVHTAHLAQTLVQLVQTNGLTVLAAETGRSGRPISEASLTGDVCLVVGGEPNGIRREVVDACSQIVEIPMADHIDSLNVANATAVCLYEIRRQRQALPHRP